MTNPDNIVRVRARNGGRASVLEANGWCQMLSTGLLDGKGVVQNTVADLNVLVGGTPAKPDVVIAQTPSGYKVALDIVGQQPIQLTKPGSGKRYVAIVAYTDDLSLSTEETNVTGSPSTCGLIAINGTGSQLPTDSEIRSAITTDGATGSQAAYGILATVEVDYQATAITDSLITIKKAGVTSDNVDFATYIVGQEQLVGYWVDENGVRHDLYRKIINFGNLPNATSKSVDIGTTINRLICITGTAYRSSDGMNFPLPFAAAQATTGNPNIEIEARPTQIIINSQIDRSTLTAYVTIYYIK